MKTRGEKIKRYTHRCVYNRTTQQMAAGANRYGTAATQKRYPDATTAGTSARLVPPGPVPRVAAAGFSRVPGRSSDGVKDRQRSCRAPFRKLHNHSNNTKTV